MITIEERIQAALDIAWSKGGAAKGVDVIEALDTAGYVIVPKEPTGRMQYIGAGVMMQRQRPTQNAASDVYQSMIAAAQKKEPAPTE